MPDLLETIKSLSDETRLKIIRLLLEHDYCVGALSSKLSITESAVSQHLKILRSSDLVKGEKRGYFTHYQVNRDLLKWISGEIMLLAEIEMKASSCRKLNSADNKCCRKSVPGDCKSCLEQSSSIEE
jgi:DNA-binding transcriptional ArsR family regulator